MGHGGGRPGRLRVLGYVSVVWKRYEGYDCVPGGGRLLTVLRVRNIEARIDICVPDVVCGMYPAQGKRGNVAEGDVGPIQWEKRRSANKCT